MRRKKLLIALSASLLCLTFSCQKNDSQKEDVTPPVGQEILNKIKSMGFSSSGILKIAGGYIVEGDIFIPETDLGKEMAGKVLQTHQTEQYRTTSLVTGWPRVIKIYMPNLGPNYDYALAGAISRLNGVRTGLTFARANNSAEANIRIAGYYENSGVNAYAGFPSGGEPYPNIMINTYRFSQISHPDGWAASIIMHEIGHCIGLRHTDFMNRAYSCFSGGNEGTGSEGAIHIPNTPTGPSPESFMLACMPDNISRSVSVSDIFALSYLYSPGGVPGPQAFFQFYNAATTDHSSWIEANISNLYPGYAYVGFTHRVFPTNVPGTVPLHRFYSHINGNSDHVYSTDINIMNGVSGWVYEGISCYVYNNPVTGSVAVYRYYNPQQSDHILTTDGNLNLSGYNNQGIVYYAIPQ